MHSLSAPTQVFEEWGVQNTPPPKMKIWSGLGTLSFELPRIPPPPKCVETNTNRCVANGYHLVQISKTQTSGGGAIQNKMWSHWKRSFMNSKTSSSVPLCVSSEHQGELGEKYDVKGHDEACEENFQQQPSRSVHWIKTYKQLCYHPQTKYGTR